MYRPHLSLMVSWSAVDKRKSDQQSIRSPWSSVGYSAGMIIIMKNNIRNFIVCSVHLIQSG